MTKRRTVRFVFYTNNIEVSAEDVALLYKYRWSVELFFKWMKQHLRIKEFYGTTENAVKIQVYADYHNLLPCVYHRDRNG